MRYRIREIRKAQGISQEILSKRSGVSRMTISGYENGGNIPAQMDTLERLAAVLGVPVSNLLDEECSAERLSTRELVQELGQRAGVETRTAEPYRDLEIKVNGPAIVLVITD